MAKGEPEVLCPIAEVSLGMGTRVPRCVQLIGNLIPRRLAWVLGESVGLPHSASRTTSYALATLDSHRAGKNSDDEAWSLDIDLLFFTHAKATDRRS